MPTHYAKSCHESAGKRKRGKTAPGNRYVRTVLCAIAWAAVRTTSQFKSHFQGLVIRRGTKRAIIAIAHKVLKTVFVLRSRQIPYHDSTVDYEALAVKRNAPRWIRQLKKFGYLPKTAFYEGHVCQAPGARLSDLSLLCLG